jgi:pimeloyl-ACP methyl ester carboxylesterase
MLLRDIIRDLLVALVLVASSSAFAAEDRLVKLDTRPGVSVSVYYMKRDGATATVVLLTGGGGGIGLKKDVPTSPNFLVRTRDLFAAGGLNVAVVNRPTDHELDYEFRVSPQHIHDLQQVVGYVKKDGGLPVWLVGTSRGTTSAAVAAIAFGNEELAGIVLTSSITSSKKVGAVASLELEAIRLPVLVLHHERDSCEVTVPRDVPRIISRLKNAPVKKLIMVNGGAGASGDPCEPLHWHGFIGMDKEAVDIIADWMKNPKP